MKNFNDTQGMEPASFRLVVQCLNHLRLQVLEKKHHLRFCSNLFNQRCQLPKFCIVTLNIMIATARQCSTQQALCWYRLPTTDQVIGSDP